jgi:NAD-reducing hydrogenase small subunit
MNDVREKKKIRVASCSLAGCFGCHMSFLDIDERVVELLDQVESCRSPLNDIKELQQADVGIVEGALCNEDNVRVLQQFRENCDILVGVGACALTGGLPAMRNHYGLAACLKEAYLDASGVVNPGIPSDPELPRLLNRVRPIQEVVLVDYCLPGCPPPADAFYELFTALLAGREPQLDRELVRFD